MVFGVSCFAGHDVSVRMCCLLVLFVFIFQGILSNQKGNPKSYVWFVLIRLTSQKKFVSWVSLQFNNIQNKCSQNRPTNT